MKLQRVDNPRTKKGKRALEKRSPLTVENTKQTLFIRGPKTSEGTRQCLRELYELKVVDSVNLSRNNVDLRPFENAVPIEKFSVKYDASMFAFGSHTKKRPNNLILGRLYDQQVLDMVEFGVEDFLSRKTFHKSSSVHPCTKPCLIFCGQEFEDFGENERIKNLLVDFFGGVDITGFRLKGFKNALMFTIVEKLIYVRCYKIQMKDSGLRTPKVELEEIGPSFALSIRRTKLASAGMFKTACKKPQILKIGKKKNISMDKFGSKLGRIHMSKQNLNDIQTRKRKALQRNVKTFAEDVGDVGNDEE